MMVSSKPAVIALALAGCLAAHAHAQNTAAEGQQTFRNADAGNAPLDERLDDKKKNDKIRVSVDTCIFKDVKFEEKERHSRLYNDLQAIFGKVFAQESTPKANCPSYDPFPYTLKYERSQLTITAVGATDKDTATMTVITGPKEHLYLGLDLPVTQRKQLKYDSGTRTLQPQDTNPQLYLSINWYMGDLAAKQEKLKALSTDRISFKAMVLADSRPFDSYALGVGYQMPKLDVADLSAVSVFLGHFWTKEDRVTAAGAGELNQGTGRDWRVGITYDVGSGLKYLKAN